VLLIATGCVVVIGTNTATADPVCTVSPVLVNSCRAWLGAAAAGNPGAPHSPVGQFNYLQNTLVGKPLDVFRDYDNCTGTGCSIGNVPMASGSPEATFAKAGKIVDINWKPATNWADVANGKVDAEINQAAANIKALGTEKVFLTVWHEPQNDVTSAPGCGTLKGKAGTPADYVAMWHHVETIFQNRHVTNVVWNMDYMSSAGKNGAFDCLVPRLWPGNGLVDWVTWDTYSRGMTWDQTSGRFYHLLETDNSSATDFESKVWGIGEFGTCKQPDTGTTAIQYFDSVRTAVTGDTYPRLKMYLIFADTGNDSGPGCLTDYDTNGTKDMPKQKAFNDLADTILAGGYFGSPTGH
jgi:hypothetical protein